MAKYIKFDDACEELHKNTLLTDNNKHWAVEAISQAPSVELAPVIHAAWVTVYDDEDFSCGIECTNCHSQKTGVLMIKTKYCDECGAKMDELVESVKL